VPSWDNRHSRSLYARNLQEFLNIDIALTEDYPQGTSIKHIMIWNYCLGIWMITSKNDMAAVLASYAEAGFLECLNRIRT
jgi:hypothetical protein